MTASAQSGRFVGRRARGRTGLERIECSHDETGTGSLVQQPSLLCGGRHGVPARIRQEFDLPTPPVLLLPRIPPDQGKTA